MDVDGDGSLCWDEFRDAFRDESMKKKWKLLNFEPVDCKELFKLLDSGDGAIDTEEFFDGLRRMKGVAQSKDVFRLQKTLEKALDAFHLHGLLSPAAFPKRQTLRLAESH